MADSPELEPTLGIRSEAAAETIAQAVSDMLRANPSIAAQVSQFTASLMLGPAEPLAAPLEETVLLDAETRKGNSSTVPDARAGSSPTTRFGDYEILSKMAEGGMGVVYRARQTKLNRIVALKMIRSAELADEEQIQRFLVEAEAAAKLDHPGIVSVYDVGQFGEHHFYSMAFVEGESLWDRVSRSGPLLPQEAARIAHEAAEALQHAHDKGIIHRDIKPQNLLIDAQGKVRIADFGLAKLQHAEVELTTDGQILGTPAYMPPEQATGKSEQVGVASDIYSLGATLYYMLTGRPPFQSSTIAETLRQVLYEDSLSPRRLNASVPVDLETICLKCLEKAPHQRYPSGRELSLELKRFQQGDPILARPLGLAGRTYRWAKKRPAVAVLSLLVLLLGSAVGIAITVGYAQTSRALADKQTQMEIAERRGAQARQAVSNYVELVTKEELLQNDKFRPLLEAVLGEALAFNQQLVQEYQDQPEALPELARAYQDMGLINDVIGRTDEAFAAYRLAADAYSKRVDREPDSWNHRESLATCYSNLGHLSSRFGRLEEALQYHRDAVSISQNMTETKRFLGSWAMHAKTLHALSQGLRAVGKHDEMQQVLTRVATIHRRLEDAEYKSKAFIESVIDAQVSQAYLLVINEEYQKAQTLLENTIQKCDACESEYGITRNVQEARASCLEKLAFVHAQDLAWDQAMSFQQQCIAILEQLSVDYPLQPKFKQSLALAYGQLGRLVDDSGDVDEASKWFDRALEIGQTLTERELEAPSINNWAAIHNRRGWILMKQGEFSASAAAYDESLRLYDRLLELDPRMRLARQGLADVHHNAGVLLFEKGDIEQSLVRFEMARDLRDEYLSEAGAILDDRAARTHYSLYKANKKLERIEPALASLKKVIEIREHLIEDRFQFEIAMSLLSDVCLLAQLLNAKEDWQTASLHISRGLEIAERLIAVQPDNQDLNHQVALLHHVRSTQPDHLDSETGLADLELACKLWQKIIEKGTATSEQLKAAHTAHYNLGNRYGKRDRLVEAMASFSTAVRYGEQFLTIEPDNSDQLNTLATTRNRLGILHKKNKNATESLLHLTKAEEIWRRLWETSPQDYPYLIDLAGAICNQANTLRLLDENDQALSCYSKAIDLLESELANIPEPDRTKAIQFLINCNGGSGELLQELGRAEDSLKRWDRVVELADEPDRVAYRQQRLELYLLLHDYDQFETEMEQLLVTPTANDGRLAWGALIYSTAYQFVARDKSLSDEEKERLKEAFCKRAVMILGSIQSGDLQERLEWLNTQPRFDILRDRADFKQLIQILEMNQ